MKPPDLCPLLHLEHVLSSLSADKGSSQGYVETTPRSGIREGVVRIGPWLGGQFSSGADRGLNAFGSRASQENLLATPGAYH